MTRLEKLYQTIQNLKEFGFQLDENIIKETDRLEEEIIQKEILPVLANTIAPLISQIQRELTLIVEYVPDEPLSVRLTRVHSRTLQVESGIEPDSIGANPLPTESNTFTI